MPHQGTFRACIVWYISKIRSFSNHTSSMHPYGQHINSNLRYEICRLYITILVKSNALVKTHFLPLLFHVFVLEDILVIKPLLHMHIYGQHIISNFGCAVCRLHSNFNNDQFRQCVCSTFCLFMCLHCQHEQYPLIESQKMVLLKLR